LSGLLKDHHGGRLHQLRHADRQLSSYTTFLDSSFDEDFTRLRACEITLDRSRSSAAWRVDGHVVYQTQGTFIPERVGIGFGIWTMLPIRAGRSRSLDGQGMTARWRRFRLRGVDA
jgi:hypothetical protein